MYGHAFILFENLNLYTDGRWMCSCCGFEFLCENKQDAMHEHCRIIQNRDCVQVIRKENI